ncbi:hypothetical protein CDIK_4588, partial [Cucumispora dikerogammari]
LWFNNKYIGDYTKVVFVDESSFNLHINRSQERSRSGSRANLIIPIIRERSITLIRSISASGIVYSKVISHSTVNGDVFSTFLEKMCYFLKHNLNREEICIILDNARIHKE